MGFVHAKKTKNTNFYLTTDPEKVMKIFLEKLFGHSGSFWVHFAHSLFFFWREGWGGVNGGS